MPGIAFSSMRVGKKYQLVNYGDKSVFELIEVVGRNDFKLKDLNSLEYYHMSDLMKFGKGEDFELLEIR